MGGCASKKGAQAAMNVASGDRSVGGLISAGMDIGGFGKTEPLKSEPANLNLPNPNVAARASAGGGNKKSLLIGINYKGHSPGELRGCINDVAMIQTYLTKQGWPTDPDHQRILHEEVSMLPTARNIMQGMQWLVQGAKSGDSLFMHYSGHGSQMKDDGSDEDDRKDECLVPLDFKQGGGMLRDDDIYKTLVDGLPVGVKFTVILDCCHSGSGMDLPYTFQATGSSMSNFESTGTAPVQSTGTNWISKILSMVIGKVLGNRGGPVAGLLQKALKKNMSPPVANLPPEVTSEVNNIKASLAEVIMFSGCQDHQTSADVGNIATFNLPPDAGPGGAGGACTASFLSAMDETGGNVEYAKLLSIMRKKLGEKRFTQVPQLSSTHPVKMTDKFSLT